jgi:hypothetical protein
MRLSISTCVLGFALLFIPRVYAQNAYPPKQDVFAAFKDADYFVRRYDDLSGRLDLRGRSEPSKTPEGIPIFPNYAEVSAKAHRHASELKTQLERLQSPPETWSASDLLVMQTGLDDLHSDMSLMCGSVTECEKVGISVNELMGVHGAYTNAREKVHDVLSRTLKAEDAELAVCRSRPRR